LALADDLLKSSLSDLKLKSNIKGEAKVSLNEYAFPRDEIIAAGLYFKKQIKKWNETRRMRFTSYRRIIRYAMA